MNTKYSVVKLTDGIQPTLMLAFQLHQLAAHLNVKAVQMVRH